MRIAPIVPGTQAELAAQEARILSERGRISTLYQVLLNSPPIAQGWEQMLSAVRNRNSLQPSLRELAILRVAVLNNAPYEFDAHVPHALAAGLSRHQVDATRESKTACAACFDKRQEVVLRLTDAMTMAIHVSDCLYTQVQAQFDTQEQLDLVATIAAYNMVSRLLVALQITH